MGQADMGQADTGHANSAQALADTHSQGTPQAASRAGDMPDRLFTIGDMARTYKVTLRALRFYEDRGLIKPIRYGVSRYYDAAARGRFETILRGKQLGFTLGQIAAMMPAEARGPDAPPAPDAPGLDLKESQILSQIVQLERKRSELDVALGELRTTHRQMTGAIDATTGERADAATAA